MFKKLLITMMLVTFGISMFAAVTGETPASGSSYYIYNVGQQKYLTVSGNTISLGTSGTQFTVAAGTTSGTYTLTASETLSSNFNGDVICSNDGWYTDWKFSLLSSTDKTYALGILEDEDAYSFSYIYYSGVLSIVANSPVMPSFTDGQWIFTSSTTPEEITYELGTVDTPSVDYDATSATINYTIIPSKGEAISCSQKVTFEANSETSEITRTGVFTDEDYNVEVKWTVKQAAMPSSEKVTTVTLYQNSTSYTMPTNMAETVDVYLYRTAMPAGNKCSFCVPFAMTYAQLQSAFGTGFKLYAYRTYSSTTNRIYYSSKGAVEAGVPYVVIPGTSTAESAEEIAAREANTSLTDTEARLYIIKGVPSSSFVSTMSSVTHGAYTYYSNLVTSTLSSSYFTFNESTGVLTRYSSANTLQGLRAYFANKDAYAKPLSMPEIEFDDEDVSGINTIESDNSDLDIYNLNGQMIRKSAQNADGLTPGLYIINGKKTVIK